MQTPSADLAPLAYRFRLFDLNRNGTSINTRKEEIGIFLDARCMRRPVPAVARTRHLSGLCVHGRLVGPCRCPGEIGGLEDVWIGIQLGGLTREADLALSKDVGVVGD